MIGEQTALPPNARIDALTFDGASVTVALRTEAAPRGVAAADVVGLFGARIRHETSTLVTSGGGINFGKIAITAATGIPVGVTNERPKQTEVTGELLHHAFALRVRDVAEVWYLLASSFNFRKALAAEATYSTELNVRQFVKKLAAFASGAKQDAYVAAICAGSALPPPLDSLRDFLKSAL